MNDNKPPHSATSSQAFNAWLLQVGADVRVAVGHYELKHIQTITTSQVANQRAVELAAHSYLVSHRVPIAPRHCQRFIVWNKYVLPIVDVALLIDALLPPQTPSVCNDYPPSEVAGAGAQTLLAITAYRDNSSDKLSYGGLLLQETPQSITVMAAQERPLTLLPSVWQVVSHAAFEHNDAVIPVLNLANLFCYSFDALHRATQAA